MDAFGLSPIMKMMILSAGVLSASGGQVECVYECV